MNEFEYDESDDVQSRRQFAFSERGKLKKPSDAGSLRNYGK